MILHDASSILASSQMVEVTLKQPTHWSILPLCSQCSVLYCEKGCSYTMGRALATRSWKNVWPRLASWNRWNRWLCQSFQYPRSLLIGSCHQHAKKNRILCFAMLMWPPSTCIHITQLIFRGSPGLLAQCPGALCTRRMPYCTICTQK